jgi:hypothetical protein
VAIVLDPSTPAPVVLTGSTSGTIATASFSPPAGSLVHVSFAVEFDSGSGTGPTVAVSDGTNAYTAGPTSYDGLAV